MEMVSISPTVEGVGYLGVLSNGTPPKTSVNGKTLQNTHVGTGCSNAVIAKHGSPLTQPIKEARFGSVGIASQTS